jgi:hypothetical protein
MSSQMNTYVMVGVMLPFDFFNHRFPDSENEVFELLEPYMDSAFKGIHHNDGLCVLFDGMCGKYIAAGRVLAKTSDHDGLPRPIDATLAMTPEMQGEVATLLQQKLQIPGPEVRVWVLSHYR